MAGLLLLALAAGLLAAGAELFVDNVAGAAHRLGLSVLAAGLLLAGAEPEELLTAVLASAQGRPDLAAGDAVGANVTVLALALGLTALVRPLPVGGRVRAYALLSALAGAGALLALADEVVSRAEGAVLLASYAGVVGVVWVRERRPPALGELAELDEERSRRPAPALLLVLAGLALMLLGGDLAVEGSSRLVAALARTDTAVGLTLLALATTAEMFALTAAALRRGVAEVAVAGVVGSAAYNATATLGAAALTTPLVTTGVRLPALAAALLPLLVVVLAPRGRLGRPAGLLLCAAYGGFVVLVLSRSVP